ncbi:sulfurtransferase TusA family protein [Chloroflexota bacterium]
MDLKNVKADVTLDMRGVSCPLPPLKTARALGKMESGQVLEVMGYNLMAKWSSPWVARTLGNHLLGSFEDEHGVNRAFYQKA